MLSIGGDGSASKPTATTTKEGGTKVLSIGGDTSGAKPKTKVLSIGGSSAPAAAKEDDAKPEPTNAPEAGQKTTAAKAIKKTGEKTGKAAASSGKTSPTSSGRSSPTPGEKKAARDADAVTKEQAADVDDDTLKEIYGKEHVNIIFIGHVDAGKSTLGGSILWTTGMVDERTMEKYKKEAKDLGRESWYLSWVMDLTKEERSKGKTVEVGRGFFETDKRRYSILDAPGHKTYVPSMIGGASQADVGILVISARKGEYETGFEKGGQTREHAMLAKTQGVNKLVVVINKMDDPTVEWSEERYKECTTKLQVFLKGTGYNLKTDVFFMPVAAQSMLNIKDRLPAGTAPWWDGPSLLEYLDNMKALERKVNAPFMMPVNSKYRDLGTMIDGKVEAGVVRKGMSLVMMPRKSNIEVSAVFGEQEDEIGIAQCGDQVRLRLKGVEEEDVLPGFVLCSPKRLVHCVSEFEAQIRILDLKSILSAGFNCVLHVHAAIEEVTFSALLHKLQKGTGRKSKLPPTHAKKGDSIIARLQVIGAAGQVCVEKFEDYAQMGRFTLRDQVCSPIPRISPIIQYADLCRVKPLPLVKSPSSSPAPTPKSRPCLRSHEAGTLRVGGCHEEGKKKDWQMRVGGKVAIQNIHVVLTFPVLATRTMTMEVVMPWCCDDVAVRACVVVRLPLNGCTRSDELPHSGLVVPAMPRLTALFTWLTYSSSSLH